MALKAYSLARDGALHLTLHFRVREFACGMVPTPFLWRKNWPPCWKPSVCISGVRWPLPAGSAPLPTTLLSPRFAPQPASVRGGPLISGWRASAVAEAAAYAETLLPGKGGIGAIRPAKAAPAAGYIWTPAAPKPAGRAESGPSSDLKFTTKIRERRTLYEKALQDLASTMARTAALALAPDQPAAELYRPFRAAHRVRTAGAAGKHRHHGGSGAGELVGEQQLHPRSH